MMATIRYRCGHTGEAAVADQRLAELHLDIHCQPCAELQPAICLVRPYEDQFEIVIPFSRLTRDLQEQEPWREERGYKRCNNVQLSDFAASLTRRAEDAWHRIFSAQELPLEINRLSQSGFQVKMEIQSPQSRTAAA